MKDKLQPIEQEIDQMINAFYEIEEFAVAHLEEITDEQKDEQEIEMMEEEVD